MNCSNHDQTPAVAQCAQCGRALCQACAIHWQDRITCKDCLERTAPQGAHREALRKSPVLAGLLSLLPGLGQVYVGYYLVGFIHLVVVGLVITMISSHHDASPDLAPFFGLFLSFFWIFNIIDAVRRANLYNAHLAGGREVKPPTDSPLVGGIVLLIAGLVLTLEITMGIEMEFLETTWPLGILAAAAYLIWKYVRTRAQLRAPAAGRVEIDQPREAGRE